MISDSVQAVTPGSQRTESEQLIAAQRHPHEFSALRAMMAMTAAPIP